MIIKIKPEQILYKKNIQNLCKIPFYGHPKGCPNYGKKQGCPPQPLINEVLDFNKEIYVIYTIFEVGEFAEIIRQKHPEWSPRQWYNPRYWQSRARKFQRTEEIKAVKEYSLTKIVKCPEAHGVNVTELMRNIGITLNWQWPPKHNLENITYLVSLGGFSP